MEFIALPPEITSALIESGPGAESFIEASGAWQRVGTNLEDAIVIYGEVLSSLTGAWHGPSSAAMAQAVAPYVTWLGTTAQQCQQIANSAQAAAAAFDSARAAVVPVSVVTANRTLLAQLLATNRFGSNLPAIAETEDEYQSMWANNSAVMNRYEAASAQAATLPQFSSPPSITDPSGAAAQGSAATSAAASNPADVVSELSSLISNFVDNNNLTTILANPNAGYFGLVNTYANQFLSSGFPINMLSYLAQNTQAQAFQGLGDIGAGLSEGQSALGTATANLSSAVRGIGSAPTAAMGVGVTVGKLTAPPAVVGLLPASQAPVQLASAATPLTAADPGFLPPLMPPPITAGSGWRKRKQQKYEDIQIGAELKGTVMPRPPSAG